MSKDCCCFVDVDGCVHASVRGYVRVFVVRFFSFCACAGKSVKGVFCCFACCCCCSPCPNPGNPVRSRKVSYFVAQIVLVSKLPPFLQSSARVTLLAQGTRVQMCQVYNLLIMQTNKHVLCIDEVLQRL